MPAILLIPLMGLLVLFSVFRTDASDELVLGRLEGVQWVLLVAIGVVIGLTIALHVTVNT